SQSRGHRNQISRTRRPAADKSKTMRNSRPSNHLGPFLSLATSSTPNDLPSRSAKYPLSFLPLNPFLAEKGGEVLVSLTTKIPKCLSYCWGSLSGQREAGGRCDSCEEPAIRRRQFVRSRGCRRGCK